MSRLDRILIPLDGSSFSEQAVQLADAFRGSESETTLLRVVDSEEEAQRATDYLKVAQTRVGPSARTLVGRAGDPALEILAEIRRGKHDLVVLMTRGQRGVKRWVRGSVAEEVLRHTTVPLLLGNPTSDSLSGAGIRKILVPVGGDETAEEVLPLVQSIGRAAGAEVILFTTVRPEPDENTLAYVEEMTTLRQRARRRLEVLAASLERAGLQASSVVSIGSPADAILHTAEMFDVDLIALTTHGRSGLKRWLLGSVAEEVVRSSSKPVLLVRAREKVVVADCTSTRAAG